MSAARAANVAARRLGATAAIVALVCVPAAAQLAPVPPPSLGQSSPPPQLALRPPTVVSSPHLEASPSVVHADAVGGRRRATLAVDIAPKAGMRVYAAGNKAYTGVALNVDLPRGMTISPTKEPKAERYLFVPLSEQVLVFSGPFRLSRAVKSAAGELPDVIRGSLEYQACDDKVCYRPQTLSLTWRLEP